MAVTPKPSGTSRFLYHVLIIKIEVTLINIPFLVNSIFWFCVFILKKYNVFQLNEEKQIKALVCKDSSIHVHHMLATLRV